MNKADLLMRFVDNLYRQYIIFGIPRPVTVAPLRFLTKDDFGYIGLAMFKKGAYGMITIADPNQTLY